MRFLRLDLRAFGPFTETSLDLSQRGLHLVYGPNEAGKTTARRAFRVALFGFGHTVEFAYRHDSAALRVGLTIETQQGERFSFLRRRGRKNVLLDADGQTPLDNDPIAPLLALAGLVGENRETHFERAFAIGDAELRLGGQEILDGKGDLSSLLFMTAAGLPRLQAVERELSASASKLYLPSGSKPSINAALARWKQLGSVVQQQSLPPAEFTRHSEGVQLARENRTAIEAELAERRSRHSKLERLRDAIDPAMRLRERRSELSGFADAIRLPPDFSERRRSLFTEQQLITSSLKRLDTELQAIEDELSELAMPGELLAAKTEIERLYKRVGSYEQTCDDIPKRQAELHQFESEARRLLQEVRPDLTLNDVASLRLTRQEREGLRELASRLRDLQAAQKTVETSRRRLKKEAESAAAELERLGPDAASDAIRDAYRRADRDHDLEEQLAEIEREADRLDRQFENNVASLFSWNGTGLELARVALPASATVDRFEKDFGSLAQEGERVADQTIAKHDELRAIEADRIRLVRNRDVPTEAGLVAARQRRDELWSGIRRHLTGEAITPEESQTLSIEYEAAARRADEVVDQLRHDAARVEQLLSLSDRQQSVSEDLARLQAAEIKLRQRRQELEQEWSGHWAFLTAEPASPREMREWSTRREAALQVMEQRNAVGDRIRDLAERHEAHCRDMLDSLAHSGDVTAPKRDSLVWLLDTAEKAIAELDAAAERRRDMKATLDRATREIAEIDTSAAAEREELAALQADWSQRMQSLGLNAETGPRAAEGFLSTLGEMFEKLDKGASLLERVAQMNEHADRFTVETRETARRLDPELADLSPEVAAARLHERLVEAQRLYERRQERTDRRAMIAEERAQAQRRAEEIRASFTSLCHDAGCKEPAELPLREERSARRAKLEEQVAETESELRRLSGGRPVEEFIAEIADVDVDSIKSELKGIVDEIADLDDQRQRLTAEIGAHEQAISTMRGDATAADSAEEAEATLATIAADLETYIRFRLAARLLREGRERYRQKTGNDVLDHASTLFSQLTCGAFDGLRVDFGENDEPTLLGVRAGSGESVTTGGMSDGTADQLYLALRLAGLHAWLDKHEPMPFVVDDLLIQFDDRRAAAALETLADLSKRTQVLFFTHHAHLRRLAEEVVPRESLHVHDLVAAAVNGAGNGESLIAGASSKSAKKKPSLF